jgi:hypothetical protein
MSPVNWDAFARLPGAADVNFEKLCRSLIRRHYGQFGDFRGLANQAGVEFHLRLRLPCALGGNSRWIGWQCKWYDVTNGVNIGSSRRSKILESLEKTIKHLPGLTDWVLWTKHTLTKADQDWFYGLSKDHPTLKLALSTSDDVESLLSGVAGNLREAYFGELVVTPQILADQHRISAAPFRTRYQVEVHHIVPTEEALLRCLLNHESWNHLGQLAAHMARSASDLWEYAAELPEQLKRDLEGLVDHGSIAKEMLSALHAAIEVGEVAAITEQLAVGLPQPSRHRRTLAKLRSAR